MAGAPGAAARRVLRHAGGTADAAMDLGAVALALASLDRPDIALAPYERHFRKLTEDVAAYVAGTRAPTPLVLRHEALVQVIHRRHGYVGTEDSFDDVDAANLTRVIDRRNGLPVAIGILYLHVCRKLGWTASGVDFPGRFLLRLETDKGRVIFDGFDGGREVSTPELRQMLKRMAGDHAELSPAHYREAGPRAVLLRLQNNIKTRLLEAGQLKHASGILETMVLLAPLESELWRERAHLLAHQDLFTEAVACMEEFLRLNRSSDDRYNASARLQEWRAHLDS